MKHQVFVVFAASLKWGDGDGVRLCLGVKEVDSKKAPARDKTLTFAGFSFRQFRDPSKDNENTTYFLEPVRAVRYELFSLNLDDATDRKRIKRAGGTSRNQTTAGVLVSTGDAKIMNLIEGLKKQGYLVFIGNKKDGGFNPYTPTR